MKAIINFEDIQDMQLERMLGENHVRRQLTEEAMEEEQLRDAEIRKRLRSVRRWMLGACCSVIAAMVFGFSGIPELAIAGMVSAAVMALEAERV